MARRFITAADVRRLVKQEGQTELVLGPTDVVTAQAQDTARDLGLRLVNHNTVPPWSTAGRHDRPLKGPLPAPRPVETAANTTAAVTADLVTQIVTEVLRRRGAGDRALPVPNGPQRFDGRTLIAGPARPNPHPPEIDWQQQEIIGPALSGGLAAGFRSWRAGTWTHASPVSEVVYVVEGVLDVAFGGITQRSYAGDVVFIPAGTQVAYATPAWTKVFYVTAQGR